MRKFFIAAPSAASSRKPMTTYIKLAALGAALSGLFLAAPFVYADTLSASPTFGTDGLSTVTLSGSTYSRFMVYTDDPSFNYSGTKIVYSGSTPSSPYSLNLQSLYTAEGQGSIPSSGTTHYYIIKPVSNCNSQATYADCAANVGIGAEADYTLTFGGGGGGSSGGFTMLSASSSAASVGELTNLSGNSIESIILIVALSISVPLSLWIIEQILIMFELVPPRRRK